MGCRIEMRRVGSKGGTRDAIGERMRSWAYDTVSGGRGMNSNKAFGKEERLDDAVPALTPSYHHFIS